MRNQEGLVMEKLTAVTFVFFCICQTSHGFDSKLVAPDRTTNARHFHLRLEKRLSMSYWRTQYSPPILYDSISKRFNERVFYPFVACDATEPVINNLDQVPTTDGRHRTIVVINGELPGPTLVVYQHDTVMIHVENFLDRQVSIHWHGLDQTDTFFMDGVARVSQCGILPLQTFTYNFKVTNRPGTYWYQDDAGSYRGDGLFGAFVVLDPQNVARKQSQDHVALINDWQHEESREIYEKHRYDSPPSNYENAGRDFSGIPTSINPWISGLINGRGWYDVEKLEGDILSFPLSTFRVSTQNEVKLRLINVGTSFSLIFAVASHKLRVVAGDGHGVTPLLVDMVVLNPGERFDVILQRNSSMQPATHIVQIQSLEHYTHDFQSQATKHYALALLSYEDPTNTGLLDQEVASCSLGSKCVLANCPFEAFGSQSPYICTNIGNGGLQRNEPVKPVMMLNKVDQEVFLNLHYDGNRNSINGIQMVLPANPLFLTQSDRTGILPCGGECGISQICSCTSIITLKHDSVVQLVLTNKAGPGKSHMDIAGHGHPFHLHGHQFYVVKIGYPAYWSNGTVKAQNDDIVCKHNVTEFCSSPTWKYSRWSNGNLKGLFSSPLLKDTVLVPYGGYVVVRFQARNLGLWLANSQVLSEQMDGMSVMFQVGDPNQWPLPGGGYPVCGISYGQLKALKNPKI